MILQKIDTSEYKNDFMRKFNNFAEKSPIVISVAPDDIGVAVVHVGSKTKYFYPWDYSIPVKSFIHEIKRDLMNNHYPRISREVCITRPLTIDEITDKAVNLGVPINEIPDSITETITEIYRIDKILGMKDEFIIVNEETKEQYLYKMNSSAFFYLKSYRSGEFKDLSEAGEVFFKKSTLINKINKLAE